MSFEFDYTEDDTAKAQTLNNVLMNEISSFNYTLISKELVKQVGILRADYFISCDEREYQHRARINGAYIATVAKSIYLHPKARAPVVCDGKKIYETFLTPFKEYYYTRNSICINKTVKHTIHVFMERVYVMAKMEDQKTKRFCYCVKAVFDAVFNRMGKRI